MALRANSMAGRDVLDGDKTVYTVRLQGIDAPERGQPYGRASRKKLASMVAGKEVFVESSTLDSGGLAREAGACGLTPAR